MNLRGLEFSHKVGENVLCFEPDLSMAKMLYNARLLELSCLRDSRGRREPAYLVHFQGWNSRYENLGIDVKNFVSV